MKKFAAVITLMLILVSFAGCGKGDSVEIGGIRFSPEKNWEVTDQQDLTVSMTVRDGVVFQAVCTENSMTEESFVQLIEMMKENPEGSDETFEEFEEKTIFDNTKALVMWFSEEGATTMYLYMFVKDGSLYTFTMSGDLSNAEMKALDSVIKSIKVI